MQITGNDLGCDGGRPQTQGAADSFFGCGTDVAERSDGTRDLAQANFLCSSLEALEVAAKLVVPQGEFQTECDRFCMDPVRPTDLNGVLKLEGAPFQGFG